MDLYLVDTNYSRILIIDNYASLVWTERYSSYGDFELVLPLDVRWDNIRMGRYFAQSESKTLMVIEEISRTTTESGEQTMTVRGRSMESILERRVMAPWLGRETMYYEGTPGFVAYKMMRDIVVLGGWNDDDGNDIIPNVGIIDRTDTTTQIGVAVPIKSLYDAVKDLCDAHNLGFGMELRKTSPNVIIYIEEGRDRQGLYFSTQLDTLSSESYVKTETDYYNFAYVYAKGHEHRVRVGSTGTSGLQKRALSVIADDISLSDPELTQTKVTKALAQRGLEELAKHQRQEAFDGKLTGIDPYVYNTHFILGDIATLISSDGQKHKVRITEYIWASDAAGDRAYPTYTQIP